MAQCFTPEGVTTNIRKTHVRLNDVSHRFIAARFNERWPWPDLSKAKTGRRSFSKWPR